MRNMTFKEDLDDIFDKEPLYSDYSHDEIKLACKDENFYVNVDDIWYLLLKVPSKKEFGLLKCKKKRKNII